MYIYSDPERENDDYALPDVEIIYADQNDVDGWNADAMLIEEEGDTLYTPGYYYQFCFPGCLPESEPIGPFETEEEAIEEARNET